MQVLIKPGRLVQAAADSFRHFLITELAFSHFNIQFHSCLLTQSTVCALLLQNTPKHTPQWGTNKAEKPSAEQKELTNTLVKGDEENDTII